MRRLMVLATTFFTVVSVAALGSPVRAAFPGQNGRIALCDFSSGDCVVSTMNADGSGLQALHGGLSPDWSADGRKIVFEDCDRSCQVFTMNADGSAVQQVTHWNGGGGFFLDPSWSPDGGLIVFEHSPVSGCCGNIWTIRPDGTGLRQITNFTTGVDPREAEFSPDGQSITFWEVHAGGGDLAAIFVMRAAGSDIRRVTPLALDADHPEWSPDGSRIIFNNGASQPVGDIFTIQPDGTGLRQLTSVARLGQADYRPDYSPDSTTIVFQHGDPNPDANGVYTMKANGANAKFIFDTGFGPDWGPVAP